MPRTPRISSVDGRQIIKNEMKWCIITSFQYLLCYGSDCGGEPIKETKEIYDTLAQWRFEKYVK